jgi:hypothetical protein
MMYNAKTTRDNVSVAGLGLVAGAVDGNRITARKPSTMLGADIATLRI